MNVIHVFLCIAMFWLLSVVPLEATVSGPCSDCHTIHNSQGGSSLNLDGSAAPNPALTRGTCIGCHAQGGAKIVNVNGNPFPQVMHGDSLDLAGGNFAYIYGDKGSGAADAKGHNVIDLGPADAVLTGPPGSWHGTPYNSKLTCAGFMGCHGNPYTEDPFASISGAHHGRDSVLTGETVGTSYRFLKGVVGLEAPDWQNRDSEHHNEYHGHTAMVDADCEGCHSFRPGSSGVADMSISDLCVRCHSHFHEMDTEGNGVWLRHPSDILIPDSAEYSNFTAYNVDAPVGRVTVPTSASSSVTPGTDVVVCISCHVSHGSDHADLLRWDYAQMIAGGGSNENGCFICHTVKDE
ncbi:MAG: hypothetical protein A2X84_03930 [Desulfuromonadaceae bacterium GWC2_58_13]|nr:MAG: hypothetical protein A2X84_03930 [Desulfuromonadaceae bacterium GWC2_58_13]